MSRLTFGVVPGAGARHVILAPASPDPAVTIDRVFGEVVPRLRDAALEPR